MYFNCVLIYIGKNVHNLACAQAQQRLYIQYICLCYHYLINCSVSLLLTHYLDEV